ncbi:MAG: hypothetical protein IPM39_16430 [Chloroflexi bacterium]|nr:hypothetical protein [Chloroflexota bacterium]
MKVFKKDHFRVLGVLVLAIVGVLVLVQTMAASSGSGPAAAYAQSPVITSTLTFDEALAAYINSHIIHSDETPAQIPPRTTPETAVIEPPLAATGLVSYSVSLLDDTTRMGGPGEVVTYTLVLSNSGTLSDVYDITYASTWPIVVPTTTFSLTNGTAVLLAVVITIPPGANEGDSATAVITATSQSATAVSDSATLTTIAAFYKYFMPVIAKPVPPPPAPSLGATRPANNNHWLMNWSISNNTYVIGYELQQSQDPTFATGVTTYNTAANVLSQPITGIGPSARNVYYHRLRALGPDDNSPWSNVVRVIGNYRDDFSDATTGWTPLRRTTYLEQTAVRYGTGSEAGNLIIIVGDRWDWMIASPLVEAPPVPYVIEYRVRVHDGSNLVSGGMVFGGDWNGDACPEFGNIYQTDNCFNHFYNYNYIFFGPIKLLHERVDSLFWCPNCGGSPIKRVGPTQVVDDIVSNDNSLEYHTYRVEVRNDGTRLYVDGNFKASFSDTTYIHEPYFGVFASTDEYKPSIWFYDFFEVKYLD